MRLRRRSGTKELLHSLEDRVILQPKQLRGRWREVFGNDRPIHAELGMGKGRFISRMSLLYPDINFIGIDMYDELIRKASEKAEEARKEYAAAGNAVTNNLRLVLGNIEGIEEMFAPGELERIYLNFSDPWPKTRHANRRLTHPGFLAKYRNVLNEDGEIHLKTDSRSLFEFSLNSFSEMEMMLRNISLDLHGSGVAPNMVMTEYEMKFHNQGVNIHRCEAIVGERAIDRRKAELRELRERREKRAAEAAGGPASVAVPESKLVPTSASVSGDTEFAAELAPGSKQASRDAGRRRAKSVIRVDGAPRN